MIHLPPVCVRTYFVEETLLSYTGALRISMNSSPVMVSCS